ncbi:MAG: inorganic diphosphatase [Planctomycetota bacterium]|mgnify:FL=1
MRSYLDDLPSGPNVPHVVNAIIEIPKGSSNKYEYDKEMNVFRLDRTLYSPVHYPGAYGFVPRTLSEDGDPLDVVVIVEGDTFPGCLLEVRPVGVLVMRDDAGLDHKILGVPVNDPRMREVHGLQHLPKHYLAEVDYFFNIYKELEGKKSDTYGWEDCVVAHQVIAESIQRYQDFKAGLIDRWNEPTAKGKKAKIKVVKSTISTAALLSATKVYSKHAPVEVAPSHALEPKSPKRER